MATNKPANAPLPKIADVSAEITDAGHLLLSFLSGRSVTVNPDTLDTEIRKQATIHGLKQKLVDAAAIARDTNTGRSATAADKEAAVMEVFDRITRTDGTATWNKVREAGATAVGGLLVAALMQLTGKDKPAILEFLAGKSNEEKAALRKNQKVAEIIHALQAANVNPDIDTDALLGELIGEELEQERAEEEAHEGEAQHDGKPKRSHHKAATA